MSREMQPHERAHYDNLRLLWLPKQSAKLQGQMAHTLASLEREPTELDRYYVMLFGRGLITEVELVEMIGIAWTNATVSKVD